MRGYRTVLVFLCFALEKQSSSSSLPNISSRKHQEPSACAKDLVRMRNAITKEKWAMEMVDAMGKPKAGILQGDLQWVGNYDECLQLKAPTSSPPIKGRYCLLIFNLSFPWLKQGNLPALKIGICVPNSCDAIQLKETYHQSTSFLDHFPEVKKIVSSIPFAEITCIEDTKTWSTSAKLFLSFSLLLVAIVVIATTYDLAMRRKIKQGRGKYHLVKNQSEGTEELEISVEGIKNSINNKNVDQHKTLTIYNETNVYGDLLLCFSAVKNGSFILDTSDRSGQMACINGIRFLSLSWIILGHSYLYSFERTENPVDIRKFYGYLSAEPFIQGFYAVDSFFLLSGCLLAYNFLKEETSSPKGYGYWIQFYVHRYIRLTPVYAFLLGFWTCVSNYLGRGPFWSQYYPELTEKCEKNWLWNILYINNFRPPDDMCMPWSWFLSADMQFFIISPLFLISLKRWPVVGVSLSCVAILTNFLVTFLISYRNDYTLMVDEMGIIRGTLNVKKIDEFHDAIYTKPYCRMGPFLVGMLLTYVFLKINKHGTTVPKWIAVLGWTCATSCGLALVYGMHLADLGTIGSAFYNSMANTSWALCVGWIIFACLSGYGGPVHSLLSMKYFLVLARLSYCAYLIHPMVIHWFYYSLNSTINFNLKTMGMLYLAFLMLSYGLAFVASLLCEQPIIALEKALKKIFRKK